MTMSEYNEKENAKQQTYDERRTDFYVVLDFKKARSVRMVQMEDADGDKGMCLVIPMLKNGFRKWGKNRFRIIFAARKSHRDENASHILVPLVEEDVHRAMVATGVFNRYIHFAPIFGDVVPDITKIPMPPKFCKGSYGYLEMLERKTDNPEQGITLDTQSADGKIDNGVNKKGKVSAIRQKMRDKILGKTNNKKEE